MGSYQAKCGVCHAIESEDNCLFYCISRTKHGGKYYCLRCLRRILNNDRDVGWIGRAG